MDQNVPQPRSSGPLPPDLDDVGRWRSPEGRESYRQAYETAMRALPPPVRTFDAPTSFGTVRAHEFRSATSRDDVAPIVLLPGRSSGVPMWKENLPDLAAARVVYAMDALGDAGLGEQTAEIADNKDQASWIDQTFEAIGLPRIHLVGHSFGGYLAANYASLQPRRVASLSLLEPVFVFQGLNWKIFLKSIPAAIPLLPDSWRDRLLESIAGVDDIDESDPVAQMISTGQEFYHNDLPQPQRITPEKMRAWAFPVYVAMAEKSTLHDPVEAVEVARDNVPDVTAKVWPNATHSLPMEYPDQIDREILDFVSRAD